MGKKDISQSNFFDNKERFADLFNGILFGGRQVIHASELEDTDSVMVLDREDHSHKIIADKVRKWHGSYISILIQENQSYIDYGMVIRVMKEEAACYDRQRKSGFTARQWTFSCQCTLLRCRFVLLRRYHLTSDTS